MAFTPQQEQEIIQAIRRLDANARKNHFQNTQTAFLFIGGILGNSVTSYILNQYGWPTVDKKIREIWNKI